MDPIDDWIEDNLKTKEIKNCIRKALAFFSDNKLWKLLQNKNAEFSISREPLRGANRFGDFAGLGICIYQADKLLREDWLDVIFIHECAHFIDVNRSDFSRRHASSIPGTKESALAEKYRSFLVPPVRSRKNYKGRACELFARAIEEYYTIATNNSRIKIMDSFNYYVKVDTFKKYVSPFVTEYLNTL